MKRIRVVALAVLCVCLAVTASASAQQFHATVAPGTLLGKALNVQKFVPFAGAGTVECTTAATTGSITAALSLHQLVTVNYGSCKAFGFVNVDIGPAKYLLSADGLAAIEGTIGINVLGICTLTVKAQDLGTVKYKNSGKNIVEESAVTGIVSTGSGGVCGTANTGGTYTGNNEVSEDGGGTLSWG